MLFCRCTANGVPVQTTEVSPACVSLWMSSELFDTTDTLTYVSRVLSHLTLVMRLCSWQTICEHG